MNKKKLKKNENGFNNFIRWKWGFNPKFHAHKLQQNWLCCDKIEWTNKKISFTYTAYYLNRATYIVCIYKCDCVWMKI